VADRFGNGPLWLWFRPTRAEWQRLRAALCVRYDHVAVIERFVLQSLDIAPGRSRKELSALVNELFEDYPFLANSVAEALFQIALGEFTAASVCCWSKRDIRVVRHRRPRVSYAQRIDAGPVTP
jgi:hypothetical protein